MSDKIEIDKIKIDMVVKTCKKKLLCNLTETEIKEKSKELTGEMIDVEDLKRQRKDLGDHIKEKDQKIIDMRNTIHFQRELRTVDCTDNINYNSREVTTIRMDTLEIVGKRGMTKDELQIELPLDDQSEAESEAAEPEADEVTIIHPKCETCDGTGMQGLTQCQACFGSGRVDIVRCEECAGTGCTDDANGTDCETCAGSGWLEDPDYELVDDEDDDEQENEDDE